MNKLVVYYSFEGNTRFIAEHVAAAIEADILELKPVEEPAGHGFMKFFWGGKQVIKKEKPSLQSLDKNPDAYDVLLIGTPVWAWNYAPALHSFFTDHPFSGKKIALFCCHGGGKGKVFAKMRQALSGNQLIGEIDFVEPLKHDRTACAQRARDWAKTVIQNLDDDPGGGDE